MAIQVYVDPDASGTGTGVDWTNAYTSLNAAHAAEVIDHADLVTATENIIFNCRSSAGTADTLAVNFTGWQVSAAYNITILGENQTGIWDTDLYRLVHAGGVGGSIGFNEAYMVMKYMQIEKTTDNDSYSIFSDVEGSDIQRNIFYASDPNAVAGMCIYLGNSPSGTDCIVANNVLFGGGALYAIYCRNNAVGSRGLLYNNTVIGDFGTGIRGRGAYIQVKNNLVFGATDCYLESEAFEVATYNAYDEGTDPGTNGIDLSSYSDTEIFTDPANDDYSLLANLPDGGDLSSDTYFPFFNDVVGVTRSNWSGGAFEYLTIPGVHYLTVDEQETYIDVACDGYLINFPSGNTSLDGIKIYDPSKTTLYSGVGFRQHTASGVFYLRYSGDYSVTLIENTPIRVKLILKGQPNTAAAGAGTDLQTSAGTPSDVFVTQIVTVYPDRISIENLIEGASGETYTLTSSQDLNGMYSVLGQSQTAENNIAESSGSEITPNSSAQNSSDYVGSVSDEINFIGITLASSNSGTATLSQYAAGDGYYYFGFNNGTVGHEAYYIMELIIDSAEREGAAKLYTSTERLEQGDQYKDTALTLTDGSAVTQGLGVEPIGSSGFAADGAWHFTNDLKMGYKSIGATTNGLTTSITYAIFLGTIGENGTLDSVSIYDGDASAVVGYYVAVYEDDNGEPGELVWESIEQTAGANASWKTVIAGGESLIAGKGYWAGIQVEAAGDWELKYNAVTNLGQRRVSSTYGTFPDPYGTADTTYSDRQHSAFLTYSSDSFVKYTLDRIRHKKVNVIHDFPFTSGDGAVDYLVGHWKLDESSSVYATDETGNNNDGDYYNIPTFNGNSVSFDPSTSEYLDLTASLADLASEGQFTILIKFTSEFANDTANDHFLFDISNGDEYLRFYYYAGGADRFRLIHIDTGNTIQSALLSTLITNDTQYDDKDAALQSKMLLTVVCDFDGNSIKARLNDREWEEITSSDIWDTTDSLDNFTICFNNSLTYGAYEVHDIKLLDGLILPYGAYFTGNTAAQLTAGMYHKDITFYWDCNSTSAYLDSGSGLAGITMTASGNSTTTGTSGIGGSARVERTSRAYTSYHYYNTSLVNDIKDSSFTISFYFYLIDLNDDATLFSFMETSTHRIYLTVTTSGRLQFSRTDGTTQYRTYVDSLVSTGTLYHIRCVSDAVAEECRMYLDGVKVGADVYDWADVDYSSITLDQLRISGTYGNAYIDQVFITNSPYTPQIPTANGVPLDVPLLEKS